MADGKVEIDVDLNSRNADSQANKLGKTLNRGVSKACKAATASVAAVGTASVAAMGAAVKVGASFESQMSTVAAISGATGNDLERLSDKAKEMGEKTAFSATEAGEAFEYMAMAGWKTDEMLNGIEGIMDLAAASGEDLASTSDIVTDALTAFGLKAKDSGHFADVLAQASSNANTNVSMMGETFKYVAPVAGAAGYSAEDTAVAIGLMANSSIKASQAGTSLRSIISRMSSPTDKVKEAMKKLGVHMTDSNGKMRSLDDVMKDLRSGFSKLSETQKLQYAKTIAGQNAMSGMIAIVNASEKDYNKLSKSIANADGASKRMAETKLDNLQGDVTILKSKLEALGITMYESVDNPMRDIVQGAQEMTGALNTAMSGGGFDALANTIGDQLGKIASKAVEVLPELADISITIIQKFGSSLVRSAAVAFPKFVNSIGKILSELVTQAFGEVAGKSVENLFKTISSNAVPILKSLAGIIKQVISAMSPFISMVSNAAALIIPLLASALKVLSDNFDQLIPTCSAIAGDGALGNLFNVISKNLIPIIKNLIEIIGKIVQIATSFVKVVLTPFITIGTQIASFVIPLISSALEILNENLNWLVPALGAVAAAMAALWVANNWQAIILTVAQMLESVLAPVIMKLFALIAAHPLMTIITGITALTAAIVYFNDTASESSIEAQGIREQAEQLNTTLEESKSRWDDLISSYQQMQEQSAKRISDTALEMDQARSYWDELQKITDENGKIKKGYEDRAAYITGELSSALGTEITITDNQVQGYKDLQKNIKKTIIQKQLEATIDAKTAEYNEAKSNSVKLSAEIAQKEIDVAEAKKKFEAATKKANKATEEGAEDAGELRKAAGELGASYSDMNADLKKSTDQFNNMKSTISNYDKALDSVGKGTKEMKKAQKALADNTKQYGKASTDSLKEQADEAVEQYDKIKKAYDNGSKAITKEDVKNAKTAAETSLNEYKNCGKEAVNGYIKGINENKGRLSGAVVNMVNEALGEGKKAAKIHSPSRLTMQDGKFLADGYAEGFIKNDPARRITQTFRHSMRSINNAMNGEVIHTMKMGGMDSIGDAMVRSLQRAGLTVSIDGRQFGRIIKDVTR